MRRYGGRAYDPCYHQAATRSRNVNRSILDKNADAVAFAVGRYALDTSSVTGPLGTHSSGRRGGPCPPRLHARLRFAVL